jgi:hypothetical protein
MPTEGPARILLRLLAGLFLLDILVNLPGLDAASPLSSLLLPSVDLLILAAACMGVAQAGEHARLPLRFGVGALAMVLVTCAAGLRFGFDAGARLFGDGLLQRLAGWTVSALLLAAAGGAAFLVSGLLVSGLQPPVSRNVFLLLVSLAVVLQVVSGKRLFSGSVIPRLIALAGSQAR